VSTSVLAKPRTARQRERRRHALIYAGITPFVIIAVFPVYWMAITAFKQDPDLYRIDNVPFWFNLAPTLQHFKTLFYQTNYGAWIINTMTISVCVASITLLTAVPAGYALAGPAGAALGVDAVLVFAACCAVALPLAMAADPAVRGLEGALASAVTSAPSR